MTREEVLIVRELHTKLSTLAHQSVNLEVGEINRNDPKQFDFLLNLAKEYNAKLMKLVEKEISDFKTQ